MKKTVFFMVFVIVLLSIMLTGCQNSEPPQTDVWDGSVATAFESGDGTKKDPFVIKTAAQLAFLAAEVNSGADYNGKYVSMESNLDLNHLEWTPIGNGTYSFNGIFDGNGLSIKNLKITNGVHYIGTYAAGEHARYATGLFGTCKNSAIQNLTIDQADLAINNVSDRREIVAGVLIGDLRTDTHTEISNIKISNAKIIGNFKVEGVLTGLKVGGVAGYIQSEEGASCTLSQLQSDVLVSIEDGKTEGNYIGGLIGMLKMEDVCEMTDCASYLSVEIDPNDCYFRDNCFGTIGYLSARYETVALTNIFSKIAVNMIHVIEYGGSPYSAYVIAGKTNGGIERNGGYKFENVFGYIEQTDPKTGERVIATELHTIQYPEIYTESNCQGCESLPEHHGLDKKVWDLNDPSNPKLK